VARQQGGRLFAQHLRATGGNGGLLRRFGGLGLGLCEFLAQRVEGLRKGLLFFPIGRFRRGERLLLELQADFAALFLFLGELMHATSLLVLRVRFGEVRGERGRRLPFREQSGQLRPCDGEARLPLLRLLRPGLRFRQ
jgi:hypothetical protein